jgi:hypothetical protein
MPGGTCAALEAWVVVPFTNHAAQLDCVSHISYMPAPASRGGSLVSNSIYAAALENGALKEGELDYSWIASQYPVPSLPDLQQQVDDFLVSAPATPTPRETLWVFNVGYYDIWQLAALPLDMSKDLIEAQVFCLFSYIDLLYNASRTQSSAAFSHFYPFLTRNTATMWVDNETTISTLAPEPFRILIPRLFDISLAPGFETRFTPPAPHSKAEEMRHAAYLTVKWDQLVDEAIATWLKAVGEQPPEGGNEKQVIEKYDAGGHLFLVPPARREAINFDVPAYLYDAMVDRQLRNAKKPDSKAVDLRPVSESYLEVGQPCVQLGLGPNQTHTSRPPTSVPSSDALGFVCNNPDDFLFWNDFTVTQRAVNEIGRLAAERFTRHVKAGAQWLRWYQELPELRI